jgi:hypothetical protein
MRLDEMTGGETIETSLSTGADEAAIEALRVGLRGALLRPGADSSETPRQVWTRGARSLDRH